MLNHQTDTYWNLISSLLSYKSCIVTRLVTTLYRNFFFIQPKLLLHSNTELCTVSSAEHSFNKCYYCLAIHKIAVTQTASTNLHPPPPKYPFYSSLTFVSGGGSHKQEGPVSITKMPTHQPKRSAFHLSVIHFQYSILLILLNSSMTLWSRTHPTSTFHWVNPFSLCRFNQKCHFLREILNHPNIRWGSPFNNFFWNSLCLFPCNTHCILSMMGAHLVNIILPTGLFHACCDNSHFIPHSSPTISIRICTMYIIKTYRIMNKPNYTQTSNKLSVFQTTVHRLVCSNLSYDQHFF